MDDQRARQDHSAKDAGPADPITPPAAGFAAMTAEQRRILGSQAGVARTSGGRPIASTPRPGRMAHQKGTAHQFTIDEARVDRKKGAAARRSIQR